MKKRVKKAKTWRAKGRLILSKYAKMILRGWK